MVELGFAHGIHALLQLAHSPARPHVYRTVVQGNGQGQGGGAAQSIPKVLFEQVGRLCAGAGADVIGIHVAVHVQINVGAGARKGFGLRAGFAVFVLAQALLARLLGKILHPAQ